MSYDKIFNSAVNRGIQQGMEIGTKIDPTLHGPIRQIRQAMIDTFEVNKLSGQQEFVAVVLAQMTNVSTGHANRKLIRIKARIPEIHSFLPVPRGKRDWERMAYYPTFIGKSDDLAVSSISPGTHVRVTFENMWNFAQGTITKVLSLSGIDEDASSTTRTNSKYARGQRHRGAEGAPDPGTIFTTEELMNKDTLKEAMPTRIFTLSHTNKGRSRKWLWEEKDGKIPWRDGWVYGSGGLSVTGAEGRANINALAATYDLVGYYWSQYEGPEPPIPNLNLTPQNLAKITAKSPAFHHVSMKNEIGAVEFETYITDLESLLQHGAPTTATGGPSPIIEAEFKKSFKLMTTQSTALDPYHGTSRVSRHKVGQATDYKMIVGGKKVSPLQAYIGFLKLIDAGVLPAGGLGAYFCNGKRCGSASSPSKIITTGICHYDWGMDSGRPTKWVWWDGKGIDVRDYLTFTDDDGNHICKISKGGSLAGIAGGFKKIYDDYEQGKKAWLTFGAQKGVNGGKGYKLVSASGIPGDAPGIDSGGSWYATKNDILIPEVNRSVLKPTTWKKIYTSPYNIERTLLRA